MGGQGPPGPPPSYGPAVTVHILAKLNVFAHRQSTYTHALIKYYLPCPNQYDNAHTVNKHMYHFRLQ